MDRLLGRQVHGLAAQASDPSTPWPPSTENVWLSGVSVSFLVSQLWHNDNPFKTQTAVLDVLPLVCGFVCSSLRNLTSIGILICLWIIAQVGEQVSSGIAEWPGTVACWAHRVWAVQKKMIEYDRVCLITALSLKWSSGKILTQVTVP